VVLQWHTLGFNFGSHWRGSRKGSGGGMLECIQVRVQVLLHNPLLIIIILKYAMISHQQPLSTCRTFKQPFASIPQHPPVPSHHQSVRRVSSRSRQLPVTLTNGIQCYTRPPTCPPTPSHVTPVSSTAKNSSSHIPPSPPWAVEWRAC
jgi:hypothetical protein